MNDKVTNAMARVKALVNTDSVRVKGGKSYVMVQDRVDAFRQEFGFEYGIITEVLENMDKHCIVQAKVTKNNEVIGSGLAIEYKSASAVNQTSSIENAETSAIGRALASLGLSGGEYASGNEIDAVDRKKQAQESQKLQPAATPTKEPEPKKEVSPQLQAWVDKFYKELNAAKTAEEMMELKDKTDKGHDRIKDLGHIELHNKLFEDFKDKYERLKYNG
tara:strand:- start:1285 stop:1941 length:657 start_codon:yes stop_codon:yes gene_type:complete